MKVLRQFQFLPFGLMFLYTLTLSAQGQLSVRKVPDPIMKALLLNKQGRSYDALSILEPFVRNDAKDLDKFTHGVALNVLGSSYRNLGRYDEARHNFEEAVHVLNALPDGQTETASALNNLGGVEELSGQLDAAKKLRLRARRLYQEQQDHAGMALASSNLANIAIKQDDLSTARKRMKEALSELSLTDSLDDENLSAIYTVKGALARSEGDYPGAIAAYQQAMQFLSHGYGPDCSKLGVVYALRAEAYGFAKDYSSSVRDFRKALTLLGMEGQSSGDSLKTKLAYASVLRSMGAKPDAARMETEARRGLEKLNHSQCNGCTITAESFR